MEILEWHTMKINILLFPCRRLEYETLYYFYRNFIWPYIYIKYHIHFICSMF